LSDDRGEAIFRGEALEANEEEVLEEDADEEGRLM
jgi:hypothetical protein